MRTKQPRFLLMTFCVTIAVALPLLAQKVIVEEVEIRGNRLVAREEILKVIKTRTGDAYKEQVVKEDFERVMQMGFFDPLHSKVITQEGARKGVIVIFSLQEIKKD